MQGSIRRVHKLQVTGQDEASLGDAINALQDAFRVASLPGLPPHGLLLVRKLDLGTFKSRASSLELSHLIDESIRTLASSAICVDQIEQPQQDLVWFSDPAQAAICLTGMVATQRAPSAWYWQAVFPSWRPGMQLAQTLEAIASDLNGEPAVHAVMSRVIENQVIHGSAGSILQSLNPRLAQSLLVEAGIFSGPDERKLDHAAAGSNVPRTRFAPAWVETIARAIATWGSRDPRTLWLGYSALTTQNPALTIGEDLLRRIETAIDAVPNSQSATANAAVRDQVSRRRSRPATAPIEVETPHNAASKRQYEASEPAQQPRELPAAFDAAANRGHARVQSDSSEVDSKPRFRFRAADATAAPANTNREIAIEPEYHDPPGPSDLAVTEESSRPENEAARYANRAPAMTTFSGLVDSPQSGLAFLIPLLGLLSIKQLLAQNPALATLNLPARVIVDIARRLDVSADHPLILNLPELPALESWGIEYFACPGDWRHLLGAHGDARPTLHRFYTTSSGSHCYLTDRSQKLVLHMGPDKLPTWMAQLPITEHSGLFEGPTLDDLGRTLQLLICRYLRRFAGMSLRQLVNRSGQLACSRTHFDILFQTRQMDIGIRRSGLDIDPGWVAWLARVVQFHYDDGDQIDG